MYGVECAAVLRVAQEHPKSGDRNAGDVVRQSGRNRGRGDGVA
jgi:hypothetical protein